MRLSRVQLHRLRHYWFWFWRRNFGLHLRRRWRRWRNRNFRNRPHQLHNAEVQCRFHLLREEQRNHQQEAKNCELSGGAQADAVPARLGIREQGKACCYRPGTDSFPPCLWIARTAAVCLKPDAHRVLTWWICNHRCHPRAASWNSGLQTGIVLGFQALPSPLAE